ncbi:MAG: hypothetical protein ACM3X6_02970 [Patescibacteria group bacterium]
MADCGIDCGARRIPPYTMRRMPTHPTPSKLDAETASPVYERLRDYLGLEEYPRAPAMFEGGRALYHPKFPCFHQVKWMTRLKPGWRRLTYREFLELYGIPYQPR